MGVCSVGKLLILMLGEIAVEEVVFRKLLLRKL